MRKKSWIKIGFLIVIFIFILEGVCIVPSQVQAAETPITIKSCKLNSSGKKLTVKAKVKKKTKAMGKKLYLLNLDSYVKETGKKSVKPLKSVKTKKGTITFKVNYKSTMLFQKFVVAHKNGKKYKIVSDAFYITNPEVFATYKGKGPQVNSKKGLQVEELSDSLEIGTKHAVINWTLNSLLNNNAINKIPFIYNNQTYYLDADILKKNDELVQAYNAAGVRVTVILLLPKDAASTGTAAMQYGGYGYTKFSSVNTSTKKGSRTFEAVMTYLAKRYGTEENLVTGWILGNEINVPCIWNYGGDKSLDKYIKDYARSFRICYNAVKSVNKNAHVYVSLDNNWTRDIDNKGNRYYGSKAIVDKLYSQLKKQGNIPFQIAYHAYPQGMGDPIFWDDSWATNGNDTKIINFKNLSVLTEYARKNFGKKYTVMLSEQSFNSSRGEAVQAAAYAYAYYLCEANDMVEAFIYGREFDHTEEMAEGYYWGLCDTWHVKRLVWSVFQYIDTVDGFTFTEPLLQYTDLGKWGQMKGFNKFDTSKFKSLFQKAQVTSVKPNTTVSATICWDKINTGDGYEILRNGKVIGFVTGNSTVTYTDKELTAGETYKYQIRMFKEAPLLKDAGQRYRLYGDLSDAISYIAIPGQVKLNSEKCSVEGNTITVGWKKMEDVNGYEVYRSEAGADNYELIATLDSGKGKYKDIDLHSGKSYDYKVRSFVNVNGENYYGADSEVYRAQALINLTVEYIDGQVVCNWTQWLDIERYRVRCKTTSMASFEKLETVSAFTYSCNQYIDENGNSLSFVPGEKYYFQVRAELGNGKFKNSDEVVITIPIPEEPTDTEISTELEEEPEVDTSGS